MSHLATGTGSKVTIPQGIMVLRGKEYVLTMPERFLSLPSVTWGHCRTTLIYGGSIAAELGWRT